MDQKDTLKHINELCAKKNINDVIKLCLNENVNSFGYFLTTSILRKRIGQPEIKDEMSNCHKHFLAKLQTNKIVRIKLLCNWMSSLELTNIWNKMTKGDYQWNNIHLITDATPPDIYVVINSTNEHVPLDKCIYFPMEPCMTIEKWGFWADKTIKNKFLFYGDHQEYMNNIEWHLNKTYNELLDTTPSKQYDIEISCILSSKYTDEGHQKRINFVKYIENHIPIHVYGQNTYSYRNYKGTLPYHCKDDGLFPYKYHFNGENHDNNDYYITEKLIDGILSECVVFYYGSAKSLQIFNPDCFVRLELKDFEHDLAIVKQCIENDIWSKKIDLIRKEKKRILQEMSMFAQIEKILKLTNKL